jgi:hypothetical protein
VPEGSSGGRAAWGRGPRPLLTSRIRRCTKRAHERSIVLPARRAWYPDPDRLEARFARFRDAAA